MKHLIVGDIHGFHHNLRKFLLHHGVINKRGERINRDEWKVYCTGDLIDGDYNRAGDILNLEFAEEWFDAICIGNHEAAFFGGRDFGTRRKHDRKTQRYLLNLIDKGVYVPAYLVDGYLLVHGGLSDKFDFLTVEDAYQYITAMWDMLPELDTEVGLFDWVGPARYSGYGTDPTGGIFELDWTEKRNIHFPQIMGHSTYYAGPLTKRYDNGIAHYNIDVGGKTGKCVGGVIIDDETHEVTPTFWGERNYDTTKKKKLYPPEGEEMFGPEPPKKNTTTTTSYSQVPTPKAPTQLSLPKVNPVVVQKNGSTPTATPKSTTSKLPIFKRWDPTDLDDVDTVLITDPQVLDAYRQERRRGSVGRISELMTK